jgi:hypothetical protein
MLTMSLVITKPLNCDNRVTKFMAYNYQGHRRCAPAVDAPCVKLMMASAWRQRIGRDAAGPTSDGSGMVGRRPHLMPHMAMTCGYVKSVRPTLALTMTGGPPAPCLGHHDEASFHEDM